MAGLEVRSPKRVTEPERKSQDAMQGVVGSGAEEALVSRWIGAFNARDLDAMLAGLHPDVEFHPLELLGFHRSYSGHEAVRQWFADFEPLCRDHCVDLSEVSDTPDGQVLAVGALSLMSASAVAPFCGLHRIDEGQIVALHHYFSDPGTVRRLGLVL